MKSLLLSTILLAAVATAFAETRLNVLFIAVDDLRPELACYGVEGPLTPNFDRLAASGMRFDRAYCQQAVCGASRLSIMGGLYPTQTGEQTYHVEGWRKRHPNLLTLNQHLRRSGFKTIGLGKIYHGTKGAAVDQPSWDEWLAPSSRAYFDDASQEMSKAHQTGKSGSKRGPATEAADVADEYFVDGKRAEVAVEVLERLAESKERFFFGLGFSKPHLPFVAPQRYWDLYRREDFQMPENLGIPPGYPAHAANAKAGELRNYADYTGDSPKAFPDDLNRLLLHGYAASTSYVDACLGRVLGALEDTGLAETTIVVLWGDHGWKLGDHSSWCKHTNFECDTRVPLLMRVPGNPSGASTTGLVELIDLYPTLCELTGIPTPEHCQGRSFAGLLKDPEAGQRHSAYSSYPARNDMGHSIRFGNYRYTEWHPVDGGEVTAAVLTDLEVDPGEVTNVIKEPRHTEALARAKEWIAERMDLPDAESVLE